MSNVKPVSVQKFISASSKSMKAAVERANANKNTFLTMAEAAKLPAELKDNFKNHRVGNGSGAVVADDLIENFSRYAALQARKADANGNGVISLLESKNLPADLQDNFAKLRGAASSDSSAAAKSVTITEDDKNKVITVRSGQDVKLRLPANATTGYRWQITRTDRTFGYGNEHYVPSAPGSMGGSGTTVFTWKTKSSFLHLEGKHQVQLEYRRSWETGAPAKKFSVTINVVP